MQCTQCQFDNPPAMRFCGQCGAQLGRLCPSCGSENPPGFRFCGACGTPLGTEPSPTTASVDPKRSETTMPPTASPAVAPPSPVVASSGERRQATALVCELILSEPSHQGTASALAAEALHDLVNRFFDLARVEMARYGGTVQQFLGRGFLALFGAPVAYEDHAHRAAMAALSLRRRIPELASAEASSPPVARLGLATGPIVLGPGLQLVVGETPESATQLCRLAPPGEILTNGEAEHLLRGVAELAPFAGAAPGSAFRIVGGDTTSLRPAELAGRSLAPFLGRDRELAILEALGQLAGAGQGQVVGVTGEAGAGKSRLLFELRQRLMAQPAIVLHGDCLSFASGTPYLPFLQILRRLAELTEVDPPAAVASKLRAATVRLGCDPDTTLPYLLHLLGSTEGTEALAGIDPQTLRLRAFTAFRQVLLQAGRSQLVIVEIEDLHWIDQSSEELLGSLIDAAAGSALLVLLTYRAGYMPRWMDRSYVTQVSLPRLSLAESKSLVEAVLRRAHLERSLAAEIVAKAEGNPFFLEELALSLVDRGTTAELSLPGTIQGLVMARIDHHSEEHKHLLQTASVLGREVSLELLRGIWDRPVALEQLLGDLKRWEFLYETADSGNPTYVFKHALTQEVAYESLLSTHRQALHRAAGQTLEALFAGRLDEVYDRLAFHYARAEESEKTVRYLALFAEKAARRYAHSEAARALTEALGQAEKLPVERRGRESLELVLHLAESLFPLARLQETLEIFEQHRPRLDLVGEPGLTARFHFWLAHTLSYLGRSDAAEEAARAAIAAAEAAGDEATQGRAYYVLGRDAFWGGRFREGLAASLRAVVLLERSGEPWWQGQAHWVAGYHQFFLGEIDAAFASMRRAATIGEALADPRLDSSWSSGYFHAFLGDWALGIAECQGGLERARDPLNTAAAGGYLGFALFRQGDFPAAVRQLEDAVEQLERAGLKPLLSWFSAILGEALAASQRPAEAQQAALQALVASEESRFRYGEALARRTLGRLAAREGVDDVAGEHFGQALAAFEALDAPLEVANTRLDVARLAHRQEDRTLAEEHLRRARETFQSLGGANLLQEANTLAREIGAPLS